MSAACRRACGRARGRWGGMSSAGGRRQRDRLSATRVEWRWCAYCRRRADTVDHVVPRADGGTNAQDNLLPACRRCNETKGNLPLVVFLARRRAYQATV